MNIFELLNDSINIKLETYARCVGNLKWKKIYLTGYTITPPTTTPDVSTPSTKKPSKKKRNRRKKGTKTETINLSLSPADDTPSTASEIENEPKAEETPQQELNTQQLLQTIEKKQRKRSGKSKKRLQNRQQKHLDREKGRAYSAAIFAATKSEKQSYAGDTPQWMINVAVQKLHSYYPIEAHLKSIGAIVPLGGSAHRWDVRHKLTGDKIAVFFHKPHPDEPTPKWDPRWRAHIIEGLKRAGFL